MSFEESKIPARSGRRDDEIRKRGRLSWRVLLVADLLLALALAGIPIALGHAGAAHAVEPASALAVGAEDALAQIAPALPQIVNLALLDPHLASTMVPDEWIDSGIDSARVVAHEEAKPRPGAATPQTWPMGPFATARDFEQSIRTLDPAAAAALYGALKPRIEKRCQAKGASFGRCEQEIRMSLERLAAPVVTARVAGRDDTPITDTQLEFARMGAPIVNAGKAKIDAVRRAVWPVGR